MRILAIRGSNLASLQGDFEIDLEVGLKGAGLFAITGPTGAGKSTLLDALCLALFGCTPRLDGSRGPRIGREEDASRLGAYDACSLVRRGAGQAHAEVDFVGLDGGRYRARWEVRRAYGKASGKLQDPVVTLVSLPSGDPLGDHRRTETLAEISRRLGLTFPQFRRSVLLAQGDFAAFLKASGDERAELLEKMTGTDLYSRLSRAAHERAAQEKAKLARLEAELGAMRLLGEEELVALQDGLASGQAEIQAASDSLRQAEADIWWHHRLAELWKAREQAAQEVGQAREAWEEAAPLRQELAGLQTVEPLKGVLRESDQALEAQAQALEELRETEQIRASREQARLQAKAVLAAREQARTHAEEERARLEPELQKARQLDLGLDALASSLEPLRAQVLGARESQAAEHQRQVALEKEVAESSCRQERALGWLEEKENLAELVRQWDRWKRELQRFREEDEVWASEESRRPGLAEAAEQAQAAFLEAEKARKQASEALLVAREASEKVAARRRAQPLEALTSRREGLERHLEHLRGLARTAEEAGKARQAEAQARAEAQTRLAKAAQAESEAGRQAELATLQARLEEARRALEGLRASLDLQDRRAALRPGEPCPLCGAIEHPFADGQPPTSGAFAAQQERVADLERQSRDLTAALAQARTRQEIWQREAADHLRQAECLGREAELHETTWAQAAEADPDLPPLAPGCLAGPLAELEEQREAVRRLEKEALRLDQTAQEAATAVERQQKGLEEALDRVQAAEKVAREAREKAQASARQQDEAARGREAAFGELREPFAEVPGWEKPLRRNPQTFAEHCQKRVAEWNRYQEESEAARQDLARLATDLTALQARLEVETRALAEKEDSLRLLLEEKVRLEAERARVLDGEPVARVEQRLREALEVAVRDCEEARRGDSEAASLLAQVEGHLQARREEASRREGQARLTREALEGALARAGLEEAELRRRLERGADWADKVRVQLEGLETRRRDLETVLQERTRALEEHESQGQPARTAAESEQDLQAAREAQSEAQLKMARVQSALEQDAANRRQSEALARKLEERRERWRVWEGLREVIGSADGKRFRVFAQSLTLEALLAEANANLVDLAPRYRLERVPPPREASGRVAEEHLAIQVVDMDMGDAVRSVQSLSGGESFLVSLALALGLSALAAERARIDSLFIDEGFGSLDAETLEVALSCLESLQAGGRQVGIISHVSGLAERLGARVLVEPQGSGRSRVLVETAMT
ncbi:MAG: AAA family ATPase [Candidatus Xenobium sp.]|jgi:exonuclease SbcC